MYIKNQEELLDHGDVALRKQLIDAIEYALEYVDPYLRTRELVKLNHDLLSIGDLEFDLKRVRRLCVIGAGKATYPIAKALEEILSEHISEGLVIVREDETRKLSRVKVVQAGHPIPNEAGFKAAQEIVRIASDSKKDDLFLVAFTGGCSALMPYPVEGVTLEDKRRITSLLLGCGATITEINSVRKHLSRTKGGGLAKKMAPATIVNLTVSDVIGDPLDCITDPTVTDPSTFDEARTTLNKYDLWEAIPESARNYLSNASPNQETLKDYGDLRIRTFVIANNVMAAEVALSHLYARGFNSRILTTSLEGESREVGYALAAIMSEMAKYGRPLQTPAAIICAGETVVKLEDESNFGKGGPSQELAAAVALRLPRDSKVAGVFLDTDGSDGPTNFAGGLVDSSTVKRAEAQGIDIYSSLKEHKISTVFQKLGDGIRTGATGTNVMDLSILIAE